MSCLHYQSMDPSRERTYYDGQYSSYSSYTPRTQTPDTYRGGYYSSWRMAEHQGNFETPTAAKGDTYSDIRSQTGRNIYKQETMMHGDQIAIEKIQTKMKFLENSNIVMQTRNQNLITENKALASQLKEEQNEVKKLEIMIASLREELANEKLNVEQIKEEAEQRKNGSMLKASGTSTTSIVTRVDRGIQIWAVCMGCQRKLESCEKQPPTVTITKSELEVLEKDMQTLRDTIIAREEAWDKAMEREQNYRQQLTRLTTETITARHLSETRHEEVKTMSNVLLEKESELKSLQKENLYLDKLIAKLYSCCLREKEGFKASMANEMNEKDIKFVEELVRRICNAKSKQKPKSKSACFERTTYSVVHQLISPRDKSARAIKDQTSSRDSKR